MKNKIINLIDLVDSQGCDLQNASELLRILRTHYLEYSPKTTSERIIFAYNYESIDALIRATQDKIQDIEYERLKSIKILGKLQEDYCELAEKSELKEATGDGENNH